MRDRLLRFTGLLRFTDLVRFTDLAATLVFATEGAAAGAAAGLDVFGVAVVGFVTAVGGGIIRDLILGRHPPAALSSYDYFAAIVVGVGAVIIAYQWIDSIPGRVLTWLDAFGLGLFAVTGAATALRRGLNPVAAALLGTVTGCGGGVLRDVLLNRVPDVLHAHVYAVAALLGASVTVVAMRSTRSNTMAFGLGAIACIALRMTSVYLDWNLPHLAS